MGEMEMMWTQHVHCSNRGKRRPFMPPPEPLARAFKLFLGPFVSVHERMNLELPTTHAVCPGLSLSRK